MRRSVALLLSVIWFAGCDHYDGPITFKKTEVNLLILEPDHENVTRSLLISALQQQYGKPINDVYFIDGKMYYPCTVEGATFADQHKLVLIEIPPDQLPKP